MVSLTLTKTCPLSMCRFTRQLDTFYCSLFIFLLLGSTKHIHHKPATSHTKTFWEEINKKKMGKKKKKKKNNNSNNNNNNKKNDSGRRSLRKRERECVCVCVCVRERERERESSVTRRISSLLRRTVSNTYAQMARAQSCTKHVQHIGRLLHVTCRVPHGTK